MSRLKYWFSVVAILLLAFVLRVYKLDRVPVAVNWDEAAIGYNAYSLLETGKDEYGISWPIVFRSIGDFKLPGYIYTSAVAIKYLGLNDVAIRITSAISGVVFVLGVGLVIWQLNIFKTSWVLFGLLLGAISPWSLQFSRGGYEANASAALLTLGIGFWLWGRRRSWLLVAGMILITGAVYTYYTARVLSPFLLVMSLVIYRREYWEKRRLVIVSLLVSSVLLMPLMPKILGENHNRVSQVAIWKDEATSIEYSIARAQNADKWWAGLVYNRRVAYAREFMKNYLENNSLTFLFSEGDKFSRHRIFGMGYFYFWQLPMYLIGIYLLVSKAKPGYRFLLGWLLMGAVPASLTTGSPHGLRTLTTLPAFLGVITLGTAWWMGKIILRWKKPFVIGLIGVMLVSFGVYLIYYFDFTPRVVARDWGDGHKQLFNELKLIENQYDEIHISGENFKPYLYSLYYGKIDPSWYQAKGNERRIGKYFFYPADWENKSETLAKQDLARLSEGKKTLLVFTDKDKRSELKTVKEIRTSFGQVVFVLQTL